MWIVPKSIISAYAQATEVSTLDSEAFSQMCELSLMWRSKPSLRGTWLRRWKANNWMKHLCGRTLKPSTQNHFAEWWTSLAVDSLASHSAMQGNKKVQMIQDICSQTSNELSWSVNPESSSLRMSKGLFPQNLGESQTQAFSSMSWEECNQWVIDQRQAYSVRKKLAHPIDGSGCSCLVFPTMTVSDSFGSRRATAKKTHWKSNDGTTLTDSVQANWPTPTGIHADRGNHDEPLENYNKRVQDYEEGRAKGKPGKSLGVAARQIESWATPQVTDATRGEQIRKPDELTDAARQGGCRNLREDVVNWATPQARDWKDTQGTSLERPRPSGKARGTNGLLPLEVYSQANQMNNSKIGKPHEPSGTKKLSPLWVAQIMGLPMATWCVPVAWIPCDCSETELSQ